MDTKNSGDSTQIPGCEILRDDQSFEECQRREISYFFSRNMDLSSVPDSITFFHGLIVALAVVDKNNGHLKNARIVRSVYHSYDQAFLDAILKMPNWKPGSVGGKKVDVQVALHIKVRCCH